MSKRKEANAAKAAHLATQAAADANAAKLRRDKRETEAKYKTLIAQLAEREGQLAAALGIKSILADADPRPIRVMSGGKPGESTAVLVTSDWHCEERVDPATVEGVNRYDLVTAHKRVQKFFQNGLRLIDMARKRSRIDTCVLSVNGDLITGYIHEELIEGNQCSPTVACLKVYEWLREGIDLLLKEGGFKQIVIPMCWGNHGRTTLKPRVSTGAHNSFEWMTYQFVASHYANDERVQVKIADGYFNYLPIYGFTYRFHHGDGIRYHGGVGDVDIPLNKAIAQWNKFKRADVDVLSHWHTRKTARNFVINGSVIGFNAYSIRIKASYEPPQQSFFLVHPERGKTVEAPVFVT